MGGGGGVGWGRGPSRHILRTVLPPGGQSQNCSSVPQPSPLLVQSLSRVPLFATPRTAALQPSLSLTSSQRLLKLMSIGVVMPSNHLVFSCPLLSCLQSFHPATGPDGPILTVTRGLGCPVSGGHGHRGRQRAGVGVSGTPRQGSHGERAQGAGQGGDGVL